MQLYAQDSKQDLIAASKALKQADYFCLECGGIVRVRGGIHRHIHFFHLKPSDSSCKLQAKSMAHLQVQNHLLTLLPKGESFLENAFPRIGRIADVAWPSRQLIFEIQCSPIAGPEIEARNRDYASLGYQVIWILHDRQYNQYRLSNAELFLRSSPYFFTDINEDGKGKIYDQFDVFRKGLRLGKSGRLNVDLSKPSPLPEKISVEIPRMLQERMETWPFHFSGDLIDQALLNPEILQQAIELEQKIYPPQKTKQFFSHLKVWFCKIVVQPYKLVFQLLLERACK